MLKIHPIPAGIAIDERMNRFHLDLVVLDHFLVQRADGVAADVDTLALAHRDERHLATTRVDSRAWSS